MVGIKSCVILKMVILDDATKRIQHRVFAVFLKKNKNLFLFKKPGLKKNMGIIFFKTVFFSTLIFKSFFVIFP